MKQSIMLSALLFLCLIAPAPAAKSAASHDVTIKGMKFDPAQIEIAVGDKVEILAAGAYTASYASVGFNGFPPLRTYCI